MKVAIVGAGAVGGLIAARLAASDSVDVSVLARGATLAALQRDGLRVQSHGVTVQVSVRTSDDAFALGPQDCVIVTVKAPALADLAPSLAPMLGKSTIILLAMNGVPWWFCKSLPGFDAPLHSVDRDGRIERAWPLAQMLGCVVHVSARQRAPGDIEHAMGQGLIVGEPFGGVSERAQRVGALLSSAGFDARVSSSIRDDIWYKLWGNLTMNPVSALTGATVDRMLDDPLVRELCSSAMREAAVIGDRIGCRIDQTPDARHAVTSKLGAFKTSMLQDVEAGRAIELDAIVGAVHEIGRRVNVPTPCIDALLGLTRLMASQRGLYPQPCNATVDTP